MNNIFQKLLNILNLFIVINSTKKSVKHIHFKSYGCRPKTNCSKIQTIITLKTKIIILIAKK